MKVLPPNLLAKFDAGVTTLAHAWRLTRRDGLVVALTEHDRDLTFDGSVFKAAQGLSPGETQAELSFAPDRTALSGALHSDALSDTDLALGRWNDARIEAFQVDWMNPSDFIPKWQGRIAGATWRGQAFEIDVVGDEAALSGEIGRVYARTCDARLGDGRCRVDMTVAGRRFAATILEVVSDRSLRIAAPLGKITSDFVGGRFTLTNGTAQGWRGDVSAVSPSPTQWLIGLAQPFLIAPSVGDAMTLDMGCDKSFTTCKSRFGNGLNFRGQPTMPGDDVAFGGPASRGNDGGKR